MVSFRADKPVIETHTQTYGHADAGNDNTRRPKLASGKNRQTESRWKEERTDGQIDGRDHETKIPVGADAGRG